MRKVREIGNIVYSYYCVAVFFTMLLFLVMVYCAVYMMEDRRRTLIAYKANRALMIVWMKLCGFRIEIEGNEKINPERTYMFVCNHTNLLDLPVTGYFLQHYYKSLAKIELRKIPLMGFLFTVTAIFVDRSSASSRLKSTQIIVESLKTGISVLIFPEGTRNVSDAPLKSFQSGAFRTAIMAQVPIVPIVYLDHRKLNPPGTSRLHPGTIRVKVYDAIETKGMDTAQIAGLQNRIYHMMEETISKEDNTFKK